MSTVRKVVFDNSTFVRSHAKEPKGTGSWMFCSVKNPDFGVKPTFSIRDGGGHVSETPEYVMLTSYAMTLTDARRWAADVTKQYAERNNLPCT